MYGCGLYTAAPYWVEKPMSQDVAENETGTFHCRGEGIPNPTIKWLINGVPVTGEFDSAVSPHTHKHTHTHTHYEQDAVNVTVLK